MAVKTTGTEDAKTLRRRRIYVQMRLPLLREEIKNLRSERKKTTEKLKDLKDKPGEATPETKKLRQKRVYAAVRADTLKAELQALQNERKTFPERSGQGETSK